jgi:hypothetical protein
MTPEKDEEGHSSGPGESLHDHSERLSLIKSTALNAMCMGPLSSSSF